MVLLWHLSQEIAAADTNAELNAFQYFQVPVLYQRRIVDRVRCQFLRKRAAAIRPLNRQIHERGARSPNVTGDGVAPCSCPCWEGQTRPGKAKLVLDFLLRAATMTSRQHSRTKTLYKTGKTRSATAIPCCVGGDLYGRYGSCAGCGAPTRYGPPMASP